MIKKLNRPCPDCGCEMYANTAIIFCSMPPLYEATCCCGHYEYVRQDDLLNCVDMTKELCKVLGETTSE